jgi:hypothetical protein
MLLGRSAAQAISMRFPRDAGGGGRRDAPNRRRDLPGALLRREVMSSTRGIVVANEKGRISA